MSKNDKNKKKKNKKKGERELSAGTVVLLCIALVATAIAVFFIIKATVPKEETPTLPPLTQTSASPVETAPAPETATTAKTPATPDETAITTTPAQTETTETPDETTETPAPTTVPPEPDTEGMYLEIPAEEDMRKDEVEVGESVVKIGYFLPKIHAENGETEESINAYAVKAVQRAVDRITDNIHNNFDPIVMEPEDREISISFYKSAHTASVILRYELISGSGETVSEVYGINFDASGNLINVKDVLTDRAAAVDYVKLNADAGDEPDFSILEDGNAFCSAWYIDGEKLTLLYNGKTLDLLYPFVISVEFPAPAMYRV